MLPLVHGFMSAGIAIELTGRDSMTVTDGRSPRRSLHGVGRSLQSRARRKTFRYDLAMRQHPVLRLSSRWIWIAAIWVGLGLFAATQSVVVFRAEGMHHDWAHLFVTIALSWLSWLPATPAVLWLGRRYPLFPARSIGPFLIHLGACTAIGMIFGAWTAWLEILLNPWAEAAQDSFQAIWFDRFGGGFLSFVLLYAAILAIDQALQASARLARQQAEAARLNELLAKAELDALKQQFEPHFLFNTLNAIACLVRERRHDDAVTMIAAIGDLLRRVLDTSDRQRAPLGEELAFLRKYLEIQKVRFGDRLALSIDVPEELAQAPVPRLILQPMVENAIKHGIEKRAQGGCIRIAAARDAGMLTLAIYNDGPALSEPLERVGIGIANARLRLQRLYGDRFALTLCNASSGVLASVSVPMGEDS